MSERKRERDNIKSYTNKSFLTDFIKNNILQLTTDNNDKNKPAMKKESHRRS